MRLLLLILIILAPADLSSSIAIAQVVLSAQFTTRTPFQKPPLNAEAEVEIGETLIEEGQVLRTPILVVDAAGPFRGHGMRLSIQSERLALTETTEHGRFYEDPSAVTLYNFPTTSVRLGGVFMPSDASQQPQLYFWGILGREYFQAPDLKCKETVEQIVAPLKLQRQLIYAGIANGTVKLTYKEFSGDTARPAFNQDLSYDLKDGNEIGFRGARIKVLKATNTSIRYVLIKSFAE